MYSYMEMGKIQSIKLLKTWDSRTELPNMVAASQIQILSTLSVASPN